MGERFWQGFVQAAIASKDFGDALEICLRALADEAPATFEALRALADAIPAWTPEARGADLVALLGPAVEALDRIAQVLRLTARVIEASGGALAPAIGPIDPGQLEAAAEKTRAMPGGADPVRHAGALRRATFSAAGHIKRLLEGPDTCGAEGLADLTGMLHEAMAGLHANQKVLAAARCLFDPPPAAGG